MRYLQASGISVSKGYEKITGLSAAKPLTVPSGARAALVVPEGGAVRFRDDGTDPDASTGFPIAEDQPFEFSGNLRSVKLIQKSSTVTLHVYYYV
ncbi:MAG: hypothetical protein EPO41_03970 [Reyranella sp.]|uniref:hypothetical protein n=1 Tax=Reyranella sp. TaxID=1929291 RepID=UPI0011FE922F|nr:hypothetical protein [Reyranella sp.]TAJ97158.1 MAG: hypothetical protein EPO41_03970 [Reyranella sp.]